MGISTHALLQIFCSVLMISCVKCQGWNVPELTEIANPSVKLEDQDGRWVITVDEQQKGSTDPGIKLNFNGQISDLSINDVSPYAVRISNNEDGIVLIITDSPDFEPIQPLPVELIFDPPSSKRVFLDANNLDDNAPQGRLNSPKCQIEEETVLPIDSCFFTIDDADGCASNIIFTIDGQGGDDLFSTRVIQESGSSHNYPECLNIVGDSKSTTYQLILKQKLDYETAQNYFLDIAYTDQNSNSGDSPLQVIIEVQDIPDQLPAWVKFAPMKTVNEEEDDEIIVQARDQDVKVNAMICYKMEVTGDINDEERDYFSISDEKSGVINIKGIDRDKWQTNSYNLDITAFECDDETSFIQSSLAVQVLDTNNKMFLFTISPDDGQSFPTITIEENKVLTAEQSVKVEDPDEGNAGTFKATVDHPKFTVIPSTGFKNAEFIIQGLTSLDYENPEERNIQFTLTIEELADATHIAQIPIQIQVLNINDNFPEFKDSDIPLQVKESCENCVVGTVTATDADGDTITYALSYPGLEINPETGEMSGGKNVFDYEQQPQVTIQVQANDGKYTTYASITIDVEDVNDTPPTIRVENQGTVAVDEDKQSGEKVDVQILAFDPDGKANLEANIDWDATIATKNNQKIDKSQFEGMFTVDSKPSGTASTWVIEVTVAGELKWDVIDTFQLKIIVTDSETELNAESSQTTVTIVINDVNNNAPDFGDQCGENQPKLQMQESATENLVIGTIIAIDVDGPGFNTVIYSLEDPQEQRIKIDAEKGLIATGKEPVDYEIATQLEITIVATDANAENLKTSCKIKIDIIDINDEVPEGKADPETREIPEDTPDDFVITNIVGTDKDITEEFHTITYSLSLYQDIFALVKKEDGVDVVVKCTKEGGKCFDYDGNVKSYEFSVILTDYPNDPTGNQQQNSAATKITVILTDVNDNAPILSAPPENECFLTTLETTQAGFIITGADKLVASDIDSGKNSWISYNIVNVECEMTTMKICPDDVNDLFAVSGNTQTETQNVKADIKANNPLTNKYGEYLATIVATDHGDEPKESDPKKYRFCVTDTNNNAPVIEYDDQIIIRQDDKGNLVDDSTGEDVKLITATDADFGKNAEVTFTLDPNDKFNLISLGNNQAKLIGVDLSNIKEADVTIKASDNPTEGEPNHSEKKLKIKIRNLVPVEPKFSVNFFDWETRENDTNANVNLPIATDENNDESDSEPQKIYYFLIISDPDDGLDYFNVGLEDNKLTLNKPLDAFIRDNYLLTIQTTNTPKAPLPKPEDASLLSVNVTVEDINDKYPIFERDEYITSMSSGDKNLMTLKATDPDRYDTVVYGIESTDPSHLSPPVTTQDIFSIDPVSGAVQVKNYPPGATLGYVTFYASASDGEHTSEVLVYVYIVSEQFLIPFQFQNSESEVAAHTTDIARKLTEVYEATCIPGKIISTTTYSTLQVHFQDENGRPIEPTQLSRTSNNITAMSELKTYLKDEYQLILIKVGVDAVKDDSPEIINTALIAVSAVLAALLIASAIFFFIKNRNLKRHVNRLAKASVEVPIEVKGVILPNTNQNIGIGSNPMYNTEVVPELDNISTTSSTDSGLIGIEENPEFQKFYTEFIQKTETHRKDNDEMLRENPQLRGLQLTNESDMTY